MTLPVGTILPLTKVEAVKDYVKQLLEESLPAHIYFHTIGLDIRETKPIEFFYTGFGGSSIDFQLRFWKNITAQKEYLEAQSTAIIAIKKAFDKHGITIPFPITTLDFGVVGGLGINEIYPPEKIFKRSINGQGKEENGSTNGQKVPVKV